MEAESDYFDFNEIYYNSMPRPSKDEEHALDLNLIERGQHEPIKVNRQMTILDGYTRWQLLGDRGKKIKYEIRDFATPEEELDYVVECNVMRRNLTNYQKVEAMIALFGEQKFRKNTDEHKRQYVKILHSISKGNNKPREICSDISREHSSVTRLLKQMVEKYYIRAEQSKQRKIPYSYYLMPKGEELLEKNPIVKTIKEIGKDIGVDRNTVGRAIFLMENADLNTKKQLRSGSLSINKGYNLVSNKSEKKYKRVLPRTKLMCPHCDHVYMKKEFKIVS